MRCQILFEINSLALWLGVIQALKFLGDLREIFCFPLAMCHWINHFLRRKHTSVMEKQIFLGGI